MRVVIAPDSIGRLSSVAAARAVAEGWPGAEVRLVPLGEAGRGFGRASADLLGAELVEADGLSLIDSPDLLLLTGPAAALPGEAPIALDASSRPLGDALRSALETSPHDHADVVIDLSVFAGHDGGAGLLAALGATADVDLDVGVRGLDGLSRIDLNPVRRLLAGRRLVGVTSEAEAGRLLLGLRGITSLHGRDAGMEAEVLLRTDAALEQFAVLTGAASRDDTRAGVVDRPGTGAHGGLGAAVLALGGDLTTGPQYGVAAAGLTGPAGGMRGVDLVVTGCTRFDFAHRGGGVIAQAADLASTALAPCVVLAGEVLIGAREMRTMGIEAAYAITEADPRRPGAAEVVAAADLSELARRVARSWTW